MLGLPDFTTDGRRGEGGGAPPSEPAPPLPRVKTSDARMAGRAIAGRWPMSEDERRTVVDALMVIVRNPFAFDSRTVVAAGKALMDADKVNLEDETRRVAGPQITETPDGKTRLDFSAMSDEDLDRYLEANR